MSIGAIVTGLIVCAVVGLFEWLGTVEFNDDNWEE